VIVVIDMSLLGIGRPVSGTAGVTVLTIGIDSAAATASDGRVSAVGWTPATADEGSIGAARTWQPMLRETTVMAKNLMVGGGFWILGGMEKDEKLGIKIENW
jgi:hypothetical protein